MGSIFSKNPHFDEELKENLEKIKVLNENNNVLSYGLKLVPNDSNSIELKNLISYLIK